MNIIRKDLTIEEALPLIWQREPGRNYTVMVDRGRRIKHYAAYHRARDGKLLYRLGYLVRAVATVVDGEVSTVVFYAWEK